MNFVVVRMVSFEKIFKTVAQKFVCLLLKRLLDSFLNMKRLLHEVVAGLYIVQKWTVINCREGSHTINARSKKDTVTAMYI